MIKKGLKEYLTEFGENANRASEIARNLGLGAIAVVWIFKNPEGAHKLLPRPLVWALTWAVLGLGLDLLHYFIKSIALYLFYRSKESKYDKRELTDDHIGDVQSPLYIEIMAWAFYVSKISLIVTSYGILFKFLFDMDKI